MNSELQEKCGETPKTPADLTGLLQAIPYAMFLLGHEDRVEFANQPAELFLSISQQVMKRGGLSDILEPGCPLLSLIARVRSSGKTANEYAVEISLPRSQTIDVVDVYAGALAGDPDRILLVLQQRSMIQAIKRQLNNRSTARSVSGMAAMLAHEIKNPLSGIRGAAQLLMPHLSDEDRKLSELICTETDRILLLLDKMEAFAEPRPLLSDKVNIHKVLEHVIQVAKAGFGRNIIFSVNYDPSLPPVPGLRDKLIQAFLNLVKNACEAITEANASAGRIHISTSFRQGVKLVLASEGPHMSLPLVIEITDNGPGIKEGLASHLFDPFVSSKQSGSGLGLSLVAKIIDDHGGTVEYERLREQTVFRVLLPLHNDIS